MGRAQYRLKRDVTKEQGKIGKAGAKRGLWSKIGMTLGGLIAIGLTGGAAAPAVAALAAAAGTAAGGFAGRGLAAKSKGGKIRGGKFFQDEREDLISTETEGIWAGALKSGLTAGMGSYMGGVTPKLGWSSKGGFSVTAGAGKTVAAAGTEAATTAGGKGIPGMISKAISPGESAYTYSDTLLGKVGKALDVKGSAIGSRVGEGFKKIQVAQMRKKGEALRAAQSENLMQFSEAQGPPLPSTEAPIVGGDFDADRYRILKEGDALRATEARWGGEQTDTALKSLLGERGDTLTNPPVVGSFAEDELYDWSGDIGALDEQIETYNIGQAKSAKISAGLKDYQFGPGVDTSGWGKGGGSGTGFTKTQAWEEYTEPWTGYRPNEGYRPTWAPGGDVETAKFKAKWHKTLFGDK